MAAAPLHVGSLRATYRFPAGAAGERARLDRALAELLDSELERAVERSPLDLRALVCIRRLHVPVRVRLDGTDAAIAGAWAAAIGAALERSAARPSADVVRYASRREALTDVAVSVAAGSLERAWAWRRLGLWDDAGAAGPATAGAALVRVLVAQPESIVAVVAAVAATGALDGLVRAVDVAGWERLAAAALRRAGADERLAAVAGGTAAPGDRSTGTGARTVSTASARPLLRAALRVAPALGGRRPALPALAVLAALDAEPGLGRAPAQRAHDAVAAIAAALIATQSPEPPRQPAGERSSEAAREAAPPDVPPGRPAEAIPGGEPAGASAEATGGPVPDAGAEGPGAPGSAYAVRAGAQTAFGGLLFLLHLVDELALPDAFLSSPALAARPLRWSLHRLALALTGAEPDDPAALAFAGLPPDAEPPSAGAAPPDVAETAALRDAAARVADGLADALGPDAGDEPLERVCRRDATVLADPGWIELHLSSESVELDVRRAGLDLDPDYVAWLGVVVRFVYD